jgi:uncharacterized protein (TIGR02118 family)
VIGHAAAPATKEETMFKAVYVARFRADKPREEARHHWTYVHGPMADALPDMRRYVQNHVVGAIGAQGLRDGAVGFDGYACESWTDQAAFDAGMETEAWATIVDDGPVLFDVDSLDGMCASVQERVIIDGPTSPYKVVWFARFKPGMDAAEAAEHWLDVHAPIACRAPGIDRYVQNLVVGPIAGGDHVAFDGFSECWYADEAAYVRSQESAAWDELREDGGTFLDMAGLEGMSAVLEERVIKDWQAQDARV